MLMYIQLQFMRVVAPVLYVMQKHQSMFFCESHLKIAVMDKKLTYFCPLLSVFLDTF